MRWRWPNASPTPTSAAFIPGADAPQADEGGADAGVVEPVETPKVEPALDHRPRQVAAVGRLLPAEPDPFQPRVGEGEEVEAPS